MAGTVDAAADAVGTPVGDHSFPVPAPVVEACLLPLAAAVLVAAAPAERSAPDTAAGEPD